MKKLLIVLLFAVSATGYAKIENNKKDVKMKMTMKEKLADFECLYTTMTENYPYFELSKRQTGDDWRAEKEYFVEKIENTKDDLEYFMAVQEILGSINDGHVGLINPEFKNLIEQSISEGIKNYPEEKERLKPWTDVFDDKEVKEKYVYWDNLLSPHYTHVKVTEIENDSKKSPEFKIIKDNKIAYANFTTCWEQNSEKDYKSCLEFWEKIKNYENLIIDIRGNSGGSDLYFVKNVIQPLMNDKTLQVSYTLLYKSGEYVEKLAKAKTLNMFSIKNIKNKLIWNSDFNDLSKYSIDVKKVESTKETLGFKGKIFLLVDKVGFSSADGFASFSKYSKFATLVGNVTKGQGIGTDIALVKLPKSGLLFSFPWMMGLNPDGSISAEKGTEPDVEVESEDALEYVLKNLIQ